MRRERPTLLSRTFPTIARTASIAAAVLLVAATSSPNATAADRETPLSDSSVTLTVVNVSRTTPAPSDTPAPLAITLNLVNTTDQTLTTVEIRGVRATPIETQSALNDAISRPQSPDPSLSVELATRDHKPVTTSLGPRTSTTVVFQTSTELPDDPGSICLCRTAIYPLYFSAHVTDPHGTDVVVGNAQTYLPSFPTPADVQPVQVSWIWPILEHPHRLLDDSVFLDDDLATEVSVGRLDRVLQVLTTVADKVPITVLLDPELIDELAVMATGKYQVETGRNLTREPGVGADAATAWLTRLRTALAQPGVQVSFTPFADPDVESLTQDDLSWTTNLGPAAQSRITDALGSIVQSNEVAWPVGEAASQPTVDALARQGATSIVLSDQSLPSLQTDTVENGITSLQSAAGPVSALVTSASVQRMVAPVVSLGGTGYAQLPQLVAQVAIRAVESQNLGSYLPIVPPRFVNPSPDVAAAAILATSHTSWSKGLDVRDAARTIVPSDHGGLVPPDLTTGGLPSGTISVARRVGEAVPALTTMLSASDADTLIGPFPAAVQRIESSEWRDAPDKGDAVARRLGARVDQIESGVRIVQPKNGRYTLASSNSPLPIVVENTLAVPVTVRIRVASVKGLPGFSARDPGRLTIAPGERRTLQIPTRVERTGRFQVEAILLTPSGDEIGSVELSVRSTALGTIGVIITAAAGGVLALALIVRALRRLRRRRGSAVPPAAPRVPEPV
ncbi:MAG TPA: DUF6049 family protein [Jatrophihabitantaceae bacterium]|nr:DUF6049 family protein [Jatrophihabitantaceae bacterium]